LPGIAIAYTRAADLFIGGLIAGIATALGIGWLTREERIKEDTAIGVVFAGMYALGIAIISTQRSYSTDLTHILFGNVLGVQEKDLNIMLWCGVVVVATLFLFYKELVVLSFDPSHARVIKLPAEFLRLLLLVLIAVTIVASLQAVGVALMLALLVTPAATARLLVRRLHWMILIAACLGALSGIIGLYVSYHKNVASGAAIVLTSTVIFMLVFSANQLNDIRHRLLTQSSNPRKPGGRLSMPRDTSTS
jgi:ABC-type Mn2+/Zn2+ transport system permease subunit